MLATAVVVHHVETAAFDAEIRKRDPCTVGRPRRVRRFREPRCPRSRAHGEQDKSDKEPGTRRLHAGNASADSLEIFRERAITGAAFSYCPVVAFRTHNGHAATGAERRILGAAIFLSALLAVAELALMTKYAFGFDFRGTIWQASRAILDGRNPYPAAADVLRAHGPHAPAVYPPPIILAATPFGLLPFTAAAVAWDVFMLACFAVALRLVGVRDWRIYALVFLSFPMRLSVTLGQVNGLLALGTACCWRYRERRMLPAVAAAAVTAMKLFLWPLTVWLWLTGRRRQALLSVVVTVVLLVAGWAAISFHGLTDYPALLHADSQAFEGSSYSLTATLLHAGVGHGIARSASLALAIPLLAAAAHLHRKGNEPEAFFAAVSAGVLSNPILWLHSLTILFVGLAVVRPRYSPVWLLVPAFWLTLLENPTLTELLIGQTLIVSLAAAGFARRRAMPCMT